MNTLDHVIENSVKMGRLQYIVLLIISMIDFADGIEKTLIVTLQSILKTQWKLNDLDIQLMTSSYFLGIFIGTLLCAFYADQIGRAKTLHYSSLLAFLLLLWHSFAQSFEEILIQDFSLVQSLVELFFWDMLSQVILCQLQSEVKQQQLLQLFLLLERYIVQDCR